MFENFGREIVRRHTFERRRTSTRPGHDGVKVRGGDAGTKQSSENMVDPKFPVKIVSI